MHRGQAEMEQPQREPAAVLPFPSAWSSRCEPLAHRGTLGLPRPGGSERAAPAHTQLCRDGPAPVSPSVPTRQSPARTSGLSVTQHPRQRWPPPQKATPRNNCRRQPSKARQPSGQRRSAERRGHRLFREGILGPNPAPARRWPSPSEEGVGLISACDKSP